MNDLRMSLKMQLLQEGRGKVVLCPFCVYRKPFGVMGVATQMHECFAPKLPGGKYTPDLSSHVVQAVYVLENLILSCPVCNIEFLNGQDKALVFAVKMSLPDYSPERCLPKIVDIARTLRYPVQVIPATLYTLTGREFKIDFKSSTYQETIHAPQESST